VVKYGGAIGIERGDLEKVEKNKTEEEGGQSRGTPNIRRKRKR